MAWSIAPLVLAGCLLAATGALAAPAPATVGSGPCEGPVTLGCEGPEGIHCTVWVQLLPILPFVCVA